MDAHKRLIEDSVSISTKIIIIGDSGVGKTNLLTRFCQDSFRDTYTATIGVDFKVKSFHVEDKKYKLQIWDTAGQQRFKNITKSYYKGSAGIILAFSITDETSFDNVQKWMKQIDNNAGSRVIKVLVGTKLDLEQDRTISKQKAEQLAKKYRIQYFETSSKIGVNVQNVFRELVREINDKYQKEGIVAGVSQHSKIMKGQIQLIETKTEDSNCRC